MCRFLAYKGSPILLDSLLYQPKNSLIKQSFNAKELEEPLNGDGFGVGWYVPEIDPIPAVFVSTSPAWSNRNLRLIAPKIKSPLIFAHVRAASVGDISESNCHPFSYKQFIGMHNGNIGGFNVIKRVVRRNLSDEIYSWVRGQTDSEHFFALFLDKILKKGASYTGADMVTALEDTIREIEQIKTKVGIKEESYVNYCVSDGTTLVGVRFCSDPKEESLSLYYSRGSRYVCEDGVCRMIQADPNERSVLVVSEKLTELRDDWSPVKPNHFVIVDEAMNVRTQELKL